MPEGFLDRLIHGKAVDGKKPKRQFAILLEKKYLLVDYLSAGVQGQVFLVRNITTGKLYARKITKCSQKAEQDAATLEARLHKSHNDIVKMITGDNTEYKHDFLRPAVRGDPTPRHFVTMWEFCNGGTLDGMMNLLQKYNQTAVHSRKCPDAWIWSIFSCMLNSLVHLQATEPYTVHGDSHANNWFVHWPEWGSRPFLKLGDFGFAREWPRAHGHGHHPAPKSPWRRTDDPSPGAYCADVEENKRWYKKALGDMAMSASLLMHLILGPAHPDGIHERPHVTFARAAANGKGLCNYSSRLIRYINSWYTIASCDFTPTRKLPFGVMHAMQDFKTLQHDVNKKCHSVWSEHPHVENLHEFAPRTARPDARSSTPALFSDWKPLMPRTRSPHHDPDDFDRTIRGGGMTKSVSVRYGEYEVVEVEKGRGEQYKIMKKMPLQFVDETKR